MKIDKFLSNYLKSTSLKDPTRFTITSVDVEEIGKPGEKEEKLVAYFAEIDQGLVLNKANLNALVEIFNSDDTDAFKGPVVVYLDKNVMYSGKRVGGLRIRGVDGKEPK